MKTLNITILIILCLSLNLSAKKKFERISLQQGLSQSSVFCILQDSKGFMWFGTEDGLNKYDGYNFTIYKHDPLDSNSLSDSYIQTIYEDRLGNLWIGTRVGLNKLVLNTGCIMEASVTKTDKFIHYINDPNNSNSLSNNSVRAILEDKRGLLWIATEEGLNSFDVRNEKFTNFYYEESDQNSLSNNCITSILQDKEGTIWIGTWGGGLNKLIKSSASNKNGPGKQDANFTHYKHDPENPTSLSSCYIYSICEDRSGLLWIGTHNGINKLDKKTATFTYYPTTPETQIKILFEDKAGTLWAGSWGAGLNKFNKSNGTFTSYVNNPSDPGSLSSNLVYSIYEDRSGILWIGTMNGGINKFYKKEEKFAHYKHEPENHNSLSDNNVFSIYKDQFNSIWIGTYNGLNKLVFSSASELTLNSNSIEKKFTSPYLMREKKVQFTHYKLNRTGINSWCNRVFSILEDNSGLFWIGTLGGGLFKFDRDQENFIQYLSDPENRNSLSDNNIRVIYEDRSGYLWIGTMNGLNCFDRKKNKFVQYLHDPSNPYSLSDNCIYSIYEDRFGTLWFGTESGGLNKLIIPTGQHLNSNAELTKEDVISSDTIRKNINVGNVQFAHYQHDPQNPLTLSDNCVYSIYEDWQGTLWIGTSGGLNKLVPLSGSEYIMNLGSQGGMAVGPLDIGTGFKKIWEKFICYTEKDGLPNSVIYGILGDDNGNLWLSTNKGLSKFNPQTETFRNFDTNDGLQSYEFNAGAYHKCRKTGTMFFGGINGFNCFYPDSVKDNPHTPPIVLTAFKKFNEKVKFDLSVCYVNELELSYKENFFSFEFAALDYTNPEKNKYSYILKGVDNNWINSDTRRYVSYTNIDPGQYIFKVKGSNNDGVWNEEGISFKVTIFPPFWRTWWFYSLAIIFIISFIYGFHKYWLKKIETEKKILEQRIEQRTKALKQSEERVRTFIENVDDMVYFQGLDGSLSMLNPVNARITGYSLQELAANPQLRRELVHPDDLKIAEDFFAAHPEGTSSFNLEYRMRNKKGDWLWIQSRMVGAKDSAGRYIGYNCIDRDITEQKQAEETLEQERQAFRIIAEAAVNASDIPDLCNKILSGLIETLGFDFGSARLYDESKQILQPTVLIGVRGKEKISDIQPQRLDDKVHINPLVARTRKAIFAPDVSKHKISSTHKKRLKELGIGSIISWPILGTNKKLLGVLQLSTQKPKEIPVENKIFFTSVADMFATVLERKLAEEKIKATLNEKEVLLKEIHHRVKNNLQIISSLLNLQSRYIKSKKTLEMFKESQHRVRAMAYIHEKLYQSKDLAKIDITEYIRNLVNSLFRSYKIGQGLIKPTINVEKIFMDVDAAIPCGLIINELVSNSLKHAFPVKANQKENKRTLKKVKNEIRIELHHSADGKNNLIVRDNGIGFPENIDFRNTESLGLQLVITLTDQLDGMIELNRKKGTEFRIIF